jgi:hypothetical protein
VLTHCALCSPASTQLERERKASNTRVFVPVRDGLLMSLTVTPQAGGP